MVQSGRGRLPPPGRPGGGGQGDGADQGGPEGQHGLHPPGGGRPGLRPREEHPGGGRNRQGGQSGFGDFFLP